MNNENTEITPKQIEEIADLRDWQFPQPGEEHYGPNQLIAAYNVGVRKGFEKSTELYEKLIDQKLQSNINQAGDDAKTIIDFMLTGEMHPAFARLRLENWDKLEVMIGLPMKEYLSEDFNAVLDCAGQIETDQRSDFMRSVSSFLMKVKTLIKRRSGRMAFSFLTSLLHDAPRARRAQ
jgi:hypothetical protein